MAEIKTLKQGETQVLPRTVAEAVNTDSGLSVQAELDALKESTPDVSAQINEHNVAADAHANRFANYLPLSGGTMTGELVIGNEKEVIGQQANTISFSKTPNFRFLAAANLDDSEMQAVTLGFSSDDGWMTAIQVVDDGNIVLNGNDMLFSAPTIRTQSTYTPINANSIVNKKYVDDQIAAIPTPDVSAQIEAHNTSNTAHANMHWLTADDEMLSSIEPDGSIDADTLEGHPASYFATKTDLENVNVDLSNYYTKEEVDAKITQIQQLIDEAAALVDQINGEVI